LFFRRNCLGNRITLILGHYFPPKPTIFLPENYIGTHFSTDKIHGNDGISSIQVAHTQFCVAERSSQSTHFDLSPCKSLLTSNIILFPADKCNGRTQSLGTPSHETLIETASWSHLSSQPTKPGPWGGRKFLFLTPNQLVRNPPHSHETLNIGSTISGEKTTGAPSPLAHTACDPPPDGRRETVVPVVPREHPRSIIRAGHRM